MTSSLQRVDEDRVLLGPASAFPVTLLGVTPSAMEDLEKVFQDMSAVHDPRTLNRGLAGVIARFAIRCAEVDDYVDANRSCYDAASDSFIDDSGARNGARHTLHVRLDVDLQVLFAAEHPDPSRLAAMVREFGFENVSFYSRIARHRNILRVPVGHRDRARSEDLREVGLLDRSSEISTDELIGEMPLREINSIATNSVKKPYTRKTALRSDLRTDPEFAIAFRAALDRLDYCRAAPFAGESIGITLKDLTSYLARCQVVAELVGRTFYSAQVWRAPAQQMDSWIPFAQVLGVSDDRICSLCADENGKVYLATATPLRPFHLACRCTLSPIPYPEAIRMGLAAREGNRIKILNANPGKIDHR